MGGGFGGGGYNVFSGSGEKTRKRETPDLTIIKRLWKYVKHFRKNLIAGGICLIFVSFTGLITPYLHKIAIDQILTPKPPNLSAFLWWVPLFILISVVNYLLQHYQTWQMRILGERTIEMLREEMITKLQDISLRYFSEGEVGRILSRPTNDADVVRNFLRMQLSQIITSITMVSGAIFIIFFLDIRLALIAVAVLPFAITFTYYLGKYSRGAQRNALSQISGLTGRAQENFGGMRVIKAFSREDQTATDFDNNLENVRKGYLRAIRITAVVQPMVQIMRILGTIAVLYFGALFVGSGEISLGTLVAFTEYQMNYFGPLVMLTQVYDQYQAALSALERMFDLVDTSEEVKDVSAEKSVKIGDLKSVVFDDVSFGYDKKVPVIKNISFSIEGSKKMALVGPTGAGKSTVINLLERFYDPLEGRILINGHDIKDISIADLRSHMNTVLQDSFLFPICVKDNIKFGKPEATEEEIIAAAKIVGAYEFIMKLPGGYDYVIQENSSNISIGQRQLISFARTLLMDPQLLILDEATSSIDPSTELVLQNALQKLLTGRMAIIIAHRLSTIRLCDEILVIDQGRIVERGTHFELMEKGGLYSSFYKMQFREEKGI